VSSKCRGIGAPSAETIDAITDMKPQPEKSAQDVLAGLLERITYHNAENGFCVLRAKARGHRDGGFPVRKGGMACRIPAAFAVLERVQRIEALAAALNRPPPPLGPLVRPAIAARVSSTEIAWRPDRRKSDRLDGILSQIDLRV
jgi:hypothetical protein